MARPKETNKTLMDQNISYGLNIVQEGIEAQKNGEEIVDSKIDLYEIADSMEYLSRHSDVPFQVLAQKNEKIANCMKKIFFHGVNAMMKVEENLKNQPAEQAEEALLENMKMFFEEEAKLPSEIRKDLYSCFIDPTKAKKQLETLHFFMDDKAGRRSAFYLYAAIEAGWLHRPSFWAIRQEFPNIGKESNINDYLAHPTCSDNQVAAAQQAMEKHFSEIA